MYYLDYIGLATPSQLFWEPCLEFFSVNKPVLHSVLLWSIHHENDDWPNFFRDITFGQSELKCFQWRLTESHSANPKFGQFGSYVKLGFVTEFELLNESFKNYPNCSLKHYESRKLLIFVQKWNILSVANFLNDISFFKKSC